MKNNEKKKAFFQKSGTCLKNDPPPLASINPDRPCPAGSTVAERKKTCLPRAQGSPGRDGGGTSGAVTFAGKDDGMSVIVKKTEENGKPCRCVQSSSPGARPSRSGAGRLQVLSTATACRVSAASRMEHITSVT